MLLCALFLAAAMRPAGASSAGWEYRVAVDEHGYGPASRVVLGADGGLYLTTQKCVYTRSGACVNATGELVKLDAATGAELWAYRPSGAGVSGQLGRPQAPSFLDMEQAVVTAAETVAPLSEDMHYFAAAIPLGSGAAGCAVPAASGNRHAVAAVTEAACSAAAGCWAGDAAKCALVDTAQTTPCRNASNPLSGAACAAAGCCWDAGYTPGWCYRGSPPCYRPAPSPSWQYPRGAGPRWATTPPVPSPDGRATVVVACDDWPGPPGGCAVVAHGPDGGVAWRYPLPTACAGARACMCMCTPSVCTPRPAVSSTGVYVAACSSGGMVLLGLSLGSGKELFAPRLVRAYDPSDNVLGVPPYPVYSAAHDIVYVPHGEDGAAVSWISARAGATGRELWNTSVAGLDCSALRWTAAAAVSGDALLLWDNYTIRAVAAGTGEAVWDTAASGVAVVGGDTLATAEDGIVLAVVSDGERACESTLHAPWHVASFSAANGTLLGRAKSPSPYPPASATPPIAAAGLWVFGDVSLPPHMHSTIYAVAPTAP